MMEVAAKDIEKLGGTFEMVDIGKQKVKKTLILILEKWKKCLKSTLFKPRERVTLFLFVVAAPIWRADPFASHYLGPFGDGSGKEDRLYLRPSGCAAGKR